MENSGKIIGSLMVGALVGAALGILFAPDKGSNTRSKIMGGASDLADELTKKIKGQVMAIKDTVDEYQEVVEEKMSGLKATAQQKVDMTKNHS
jgi:gas vesicle protein